MVDETDMTMPRRTEEIIPREAMADDLMYGERFQQYQPPVLVEDKPALFDTYQEEFRALADDDVNGVDDELPTEEWLRHFTKGYVSSKSPMHAVRQYGRYPPFTGFSIPASYSIMMVSPRAMGGISTNEIFRKEELEP